VSDDTVPRLEYEKLAVWIGDWRAEGTNYAADGATSRWLSEETFEWLAGQFFVVQRWNEHGSTEPFIGLGVMGYDQRTARHFTRSFENHGFYRHYDMTVEGNIWTFDGPTERARVEFVDGGDTQRIHWEFKPRGQWQPLCDRVARRVKPDVPRR
jgi:hypothetical protein